MKKGNKLKKIKETISKTRVLKNKSKGLSELVSVILIIVVVVVLVIIFQLWGRAYLRNVMTESTKNKSHFENVISCNEIDVSIESCSITRYNKEINLLLKNNSDFDIYDFVLTIDGKTYDDEEYHNLILFSQAVRGGDLTSLSSKEDVSFFYQADIMDLDPRKIDNISLANQQCGNVFIDDLQCEIIDDLSDHIVAHYSLSEDDVIYEELEEEGWVSARAIGISTNQTYFEINDDVIIGQYASGAWCGPSILYNASEKTKYRLEAEFNLILTPASVKLGYHLYKDGALVDYKAPLDSQKIFVNYHDVALYNHGSLSGLITHKVDTIIDLSNAPDFDSINFAFLVGSPDTIRSPTIILNKNDIFVRQLLLKDLSGNENHGVFKGTTFTEDQRGNLNAATLFNGVNDYIYIGSKTNVDNNSIFVWVKPESWSDRVIAAGFLSANTNFYNLSTYHTPNNCFTIGGGSDVETKFSTFNSYNDDLWHNIVVNFDTTVLDMYVDGLKQQLNSGGGYRSSPYKLIGARYYQNNFDQLYKGSMSNLIVFNKILTKDEIRSLYNETRTN